MNGLVIGLFTLLGVIVGVLIAPIISEKFELRKIYLAPFRKWCADTYGELNEFFKRYLEQQHEEVPEGRLLLIMDYRELHESLRDAPKWIGKIEKDEEHNGELAKKFWTLTNTVDESWHRLGQHFRASLPAVDDVKLFEERIKNNLSGEEQMNIAKEIWKDVAKLDSASLLSILKFLKGRIPQTEFSWFITRRKKMETEERECEKVQEAKMENNIQQQEGCSHEDIYKKLGCIERKIESSSRAQKGIFTYALGAALVFLGLSYWPGLLEHIGMDTARFYLVNPVAFIVLGFIAMIFAYIVSRKNKRLEEEGDGN